MTSDCPKCHATLNWLERWRLSGVLRWRPTLPCPRCGTPLRRSAMVYLTNLASLWLMSAIVARFFDPDSRWLAGLILGLAMAMLVGALATKLEATPQPNASRE